MELNVLLAILIDNTDCSETNKIGKTLISLNGFLFCFNYSYPNGMVITCFAMSTNQLALGHLRWSASIISASSLNCSDGSESRFTTVKPR